MLTKEMQVLDRFLRMPVSSSEAVFAAFRTLPGAVEAHGAGKEGYLYVPGKREDRCVLVAHADTYFDAYYMRREIESSVGFRDGVYFSESDKSSIGADDRAGCAMLWLLADSGHSLLILDGEEHGQIGANYLREHDPALFEEINGHSFMIQLDRRGSSDYKCYRLPVTEEFIQYIETSTDYQDAGKNSRTDICTLCTSACGVNLSVGYYGEHTPEERLVCAEWLHTYELVKAMLEKPLRNFRLSQ